MKRFITIAGTVLIIGLTIVACVGSYKAHNNSIHVIPASEIGEIPERIVEVEYVEVDPVIKTETQEIFVPATVPLVRTTEFVNLTFEEMAFLQQIAMAESRGEDAYGQALVMRTVLVRSLRTGMSIEEVFYARGQFSTTNDPMFGHYEPNENNNKALGMILDGWTEKDLQIDAEWDKTKDIYYFGADGYPNYGEPAFKWGGHYFCVK